MVYKLRSNKQLKVKSAAIILTRLNFFCIKIRLTTGKFCTHTHNQLNAHRYILYLALKLCQAVFWHVNQIKVYFTVT